MRPIPAVLTAIRERSAKAGWRLAASLPFACILSCGSVRMLSQTSTTAPEYHVELMAVGVGVESSVNAPMRLSAKDVTVSWAAGAMGVEVHRFSSRQPAGDAPHLLVLFLAPPTAAELAEMTGLLPKLTTLGWQVSIADPGKTILPYGAGLTRAANAAIVSSAVPASTSATRPKGGKARTTTGEITELNRPALYALEAFPGRRVLLLNPRGGTLRRDEIMALLVRRLGQIYVLDGGLRKTETYEFSPVDADGATLSSGTMYTSEIRTVRNYDRGLVHEVTPKQAISDLLHDQKNYYDVVLRPAQPGQPLSGLVTVRLRDPHSFDIFDAELYTKRPVQGAVQRVPVNGAQLKVTTVP